MKVAIINRSDRRGGAAMVSYRLMESLREAGIDARMIVMENLSSSPEVISVGAKMSDKIPFLAERLDIFIQNGFRRDTLFQIDTASDGLALSSVPFVREADVICLNWINQGMLSLKELKRLLSLGKPIVSPVFAITPESATGLLKSVVIARSSEAGRGRMTSPIRFGKRKRIAITMPSVIVRIR